MIKTLTIGVVIFGATTILFAQTNNNLEAPGATLTKLASDYSFTEGPAADAMGNVYFTDQPNDKIIEWKAADNSLSVYMEGARRANGLYFDHHGNLLSCADLKDQLISIDKNKNITVLVNDIDGKKLNGPNDLWVDPQGGIYFTDPFYKRDYWDRTEKEIPGEKVYYLAPGASAPKVVADDLTKPNGIIGTPDGKMLYVADIAANKTYSYTINKDGSLANKQLFCELGSDGMTIDQRGDIYLTGKGVTVFDKTGEQIDHIDVNEPWTANVTFGGKDFKTLFITASKSVYTLRMSVAGAR